MTENSAMKENDKTQLLYNIAKRVAVGTVIFAGILSILLIVNYIQTKFDNIELKIEASEGQIEEGEFQDNIKEALKQIGIDIK